MIYSVIVGINHISDDNNENSARLMCDLMQSYKNCYNGFYAVPILLLNKVSVDRLRMYIENIHNRMNPGDVLLFYYNGRCHDAPFSSMDELKKLIKYQYGKYVIILDGCEWTLNIPITDDLLILSSMGHIPSMQMSGSELQWRTKILNIPSVHLYLI